MRKIAENITKLVVLVAGEFYNPLMITTDDGEIFIIEVRSGKIEVTRDELEHLILEGEILLHELREFYVEPDTSG